MQQALLSAGLPPPGIAPGQYSGRVKSYNPKQGYGFLECAEARAHYGRDVFIHKAQMGELLGRFVGPGTRLEPTALRMRVNFSVEVNKAGMPQARDVVRVDNPAEPCVVPAEVEPSSVTPAVADGAFPSPGSSPPPPYAAPLPYAALVAPGPPPGPPAEFEAEAWGEDLVVKAGVKGYKGRGGTIRILHGSEAMGLPEDLGAAKQQPGGLAIIPPGQDLSQVGVALQPPRGIRNRGWQPRGPRGPGGQASARGLEGGGTWDELACHMQQGCGGGCNGGCGGCHGGACGACDGGGATSAMPRESRRRGQKDFNFRQRQQAPVHPHYSAPGGQPVMQPQGALPIACDAQMLGGQCGAGQLQPAFAMQPCAPSGMQVYGLHGSQAMPGPQAAGPAPAYHAPYQQQYAPAFMSQQYQVQPPPYQPDLNGSYPPQFLPYQQQYQQPYVPQQLQHLAYGSPQHSLSLPTADGSQQELSPGCSFSGMDLPGTASSTLPGAVTPGSGSDDDDGRVGFRLPFHDAAPLPMAPDACPAGLAASGLATSGSPVEAPPDRNAWTVPDLDRAMGHSL